MPGAQRQFFSAYLQDRAVAALQPSSPFLLRRLLRQLEPNRLHEVIELGPGPAVATRPLLAALPADSRYLAIERNPGFSAALRQVGDPRLEVVEGDARDLRSIALGLGRTQADAIISSIPCTYLSHEERHALLGAVKSLLAPAGRFVIFHQYTPLMLPYLKKHFRSVKVEFEPLNVFPCFLFKCEK